MNLIISAVFAHAISDFIMQTDKMTKEKSQLKANGFIKHFLAVFISLLIILTLQFEFTKVFQYIILISFIHIALDFLKVVFQERIFKEARGGFFLLDQALHIIIMAAVALLLKPDIGYNGLIGGIAPVFANVFQKYPQIDLYIAITMVELYGAVYILFGMGAGFFIGIFTRPYKPEGQEGKSNNAGMYIGIFERFVIITLTILSQYSAIAFIVAAKSLARHEDLNKKGFAEYYLLGTLLSIFIGIMGGLLINFLTSFIVV